MLDIEGLLKVPHMATLLSFVLGFGIACIFRPVCKGSNCIITQGPSVSEINDAVYQFGNKCVEFKGKAVACPAPDDSKPVKVLETMQL
jgi:hypothetical protein